MAEKTNPTDERAIDDRGDNTQMRRPTVGVRVRVARPTTSDSTRWEVVLRTNGQMRRDGLARSTELDMGITATLTGWA